MTNHSPPGGPIQQQAVVALMNEVQKEQNKPAHFESCPLQRLPPPPAAALQPHSWAQVAGSITSGPSHEMMQLMSPALVTSCPGSKEGQNSDDGRSNDDLITFIPSPIPVLPEEKAGIIRILGRMNEASIAHITARIHEGPLQDIRIEAPDRARIVFQHLSHAEAFCEADKEMVVRLGFGRLGKGYRVEIAEIVDWTDDHRAMNQPIRERRRLSFARKGLFSYYKNVPGVLSPEAWKQDIRSIAGVGNIERLFVFNNGNATAIFTSTIIARRVLETVNRWKETKAVYRGVSVTYSSDPCEKELILTDDKCVLMRRHDKFRPNHPGYRPGKFRQGQPGRR
ncbi:uncharacterized protein BDW70DRAFT_148327 [Aspergillus foveolatus]|uniref:uncharacterized protein n=1 Tax=Aspergillus foveolatus TaxID=210207 RepID=UPI003CCDE2CA